MKAIGAPAAAWWHDVGSMARAAERVRGDAGRARYRFGDATLQLDTADRQLLADVRELYADCADPAAAAPAQHRLRCRVRAVPGTGLTLVAVDSGTPVDVLQLARSLLEPRIGDVVAETAAAAGPWRLLARRDRPDRPIVAVDGPRCVLATAELPPCYLRDLVVATAMAAQHAVLFLHAASVAVDGRGVLLAGRGGAGKTTLALALATRGHALLGDDFAALRRQTAELLPLRRTLHVRSGLRARAVDAALAAHAIEPETLPGGHRRRRAPPSRLFPAAPGPAPLALAFFLRGFRREPAVTPFAPSLRDLRPLQSLPIRYQWGIRPGARFVRFCLLLRLLARTRCYLLDVGRPEPTAALIESTVRAP